MPNDLSGIGFPTYQEWEFPITNCNKTIKTCSLKVLNSTTILYLYTARERARKSSTITKTVVSILTFSDSFTQEPEFLRPGTLLGKQSVPMRLSCRQSATTIVPFPAGERA